MRTSYSCQILMKLGTSSTDFRKENSDVNFHENPHSGSRVVPLGLTDRHDEASSLLMQFSERAHILGKLLAPVNSYLEYVTEQNINQQVYIEHLSA